MADVRPHRYSQGSLGSVDLENHHSDRPAQPDPIVVPHTTPDPLSEASAAAVEPVRPTTWTTSFATTCRQVIGKNPFKGSYLKLYDPLDTFLDKGIALGSAFFAIAAGVPLPIIGYIFGKSTTPQSSYQSQC